LEAGTREFNAEGDVDGLKEGADARNGELIFNVDEALEVMVLVESVVSSIITSVVFTYTSLLLSVVFSEISHFVVINVVLLSIALIVIVVSI
jgi:hypothetical protein